MTRGLVGRWGVLLAVALLVGGWAGLVVGAPAGRNVAQSTGTSGSGGGTGASGSSGSSGSGDSGSSGSGDSGTSGGDDGSDDGGGAGTGGDGGSGGDGSSEGDGTAGDGAATTAPADIPEERIAEGEPADCEGGGAGRCYAVEDAGDGTEAVRVPDGQGGFVVVPIVAVPVVDVDTGASTSAASNVDLQVRVSDDDVRVERRVAPSTQYAYITLAALLGVFVGAAVLGTFLRFRNGPRPRP